MVKTKTKKVKYCTFCGEFLNNNELVCTHCGCSKWDWTEEPTYGPEQDYPDYKGGEFREREARYYEDTGRADAYTR